MRTIEQWADNIMHVHRDNIQMLNAATLKARIEEKQSGWWIIGLHCACESERQAEELLEALKLRIATKLMLED